MYQAVYQQKVEQLQEITHAARLLAAIWRTGSRVGLPKADSWFDSSDGTRRYLLELDDGRTVETVLMPEEGRDTICISSQVGCPVDCQFCLTAKMGIERNLTAGEIVGQILLVAATSRSVSDRQPVECGDDGDGRTAPESRQCAESVAYPVRSRRRSACRRGRVTVSTAGIIPEIAEFARRADAARSSPSR